MATFKFNLASLDHCPDPKTVVEAMEEFGLPDGDEFGVLNSTASDKAIYATVIRRTQQAVQRLDDETREVLTTAVEKVSVLPMGLFPARQRLELYEGTASSIEQIGAFLGSALALPAVVNPIEVDVVSAVRRLREQTERFQLRAARIREYAHSSYVAGPYGPKFLDSESGLEFLEEHAEDVTSASVRFQGPGGRATVTLAPNACFRYSLANEDDKPAIQSLLRKLA